MFIELLRGAWGAIAGCFRRQLDAEIDRQIEVHEQAHPQAAPSPLIFNLHVSSSSDMHPRIQRFYGESDLSSPRPQLRGGL